jgi:hypothetical protein
MEQGLANKRGVMRGQIYLWVDYHLSGDEHCWLGSRAAGEHAYAGAMGLFGTLC